jgi:hypothetical protein
MPRPLKRNLYASESTHAKHLPQPLTSGPSNATRRALTLALRIGPVSSHAAPTRPPHAPEHRIRRRTSLTVLCRP